MPWPFCPLPPALCGPPAVPTEADQCSRRLCYCPVTLFLRVVGSDAEVQGLPCRLPWAKQG